MMLVVMIKTFKYIIRIISKTFKLIPRVIGENYNKDLLYSEINLEIRLSKHNSHVDTVTHT